MRKAEFRMRVLHQKLLAHELEKNNSSPKSRRLKIEIWSYKENLQNLSHEKHGIDAAVRGRKINPQSTRGRNGNSAYLISMGRLAK